MRTHTQAFLDNLATLIAQLRGKTRVDSYYCVTSSFSLFTHDIEKRAPTGIHDGLGETVVLYHIQDVQLFYSNMMIVLGVLFCRLVVEITALSRYLQVRLCRASGSLTAALRTLLATAKGALLPSQGFLRGTIITRVLNGVSLTIRQKRLQAYVYPNIRMGTHRGGMFGLCRSLAHNQGRPVIVGPMHKIDRFRSAFQRAVQLDLEGLADLCRDDQMLLVFMQIDIFAVLPELKRVKPVWFFEAGKAYFLAQLSTGQKAFERLGETICEGLYRGGGHMLTPTTFEVSRQVILTRERTSVLILGFHGCKHLIIERARLGKALHEQLALFSIWVYSVLKCPHSAVLSGSLELVKYFPPAGGRPFTPMAEARGPLTARG